MTLSNRPAQWQEEARLITRLPSATNTPKPTCVNCPNNTGVFTQGPCRLCRIEEMKANAEALPPDKRTLHVG